MIGETRSARSQQRRAARLAAQQGRARRRSARRWALYALAALVVLGGGAFALFSAATAKVYPPTGIAGHIESYPPCRICPTPIPEEIQRHILEHREPGGPTDRPGILVQYSCAPCPEVVARLTSVVERYPSGVYLAPYPGMSPLVAVTTLGQIEAMDAVDEARIIAFIERHF
jgi:hypothetical protein